jgi:hypothetical protein
MTRALIFLSIFSAMLLSPLLASAQQVMEITPFMGFMFGGDFRSYWSSDNEWRNVSVKESSDYGAFLDFAISRNAMIELMWVRHDTELENPPFATPVGDIELSRDLTLDYFHAGFMWQWTPSNIHPYVVGTLGGTRFVPEGSSSTTKFSTSIGGGAKVFFGDHFGFRFDGRIYSTYIDESDAVYCNPYYCYHFSDSTYFVQWDAKAGFIVAF